MKIEVLESKLLPAFESMFWKGEKNHPEKLEMMEALTTAIETLKRIDGGIGNIIENWFIENGGELAGCFNRSLTQAIVNYLTENSNDPKE